MFISKIKVQPISTPEFWKQIKFGGYNFDSDYRMHQWVWKLFSDAPDRKRDFIYRHDITSQGHVFLAVSQRRPEPLDDFLNVETKDYYPKIKKGMRLGFSLRANPVRSARDENQKLKRHDVVMDSKKKLAASGKTKGEIFGQEVMQEAGLKWIVGKGEANGFWVEPEVLRVDGYRSMELRTKGRNARISILEFNGLLTVTDAELFEEALFKGIGPAKGFGCGLLLARRV